MYSANFASKRPTISAAKLLPLVLWMWCERDGCGGRVIWEHSTTVIRGRAMRQSCNAINTSLGEGLHGRGCGQRVRQGWGRGRGSSPLISEQ